MTSFENEFKFNFVTCYHDNQKQNLCNTFICICWTRNFFTDLPLYSSLWQVTQLTNCLEQQGLDPY